MDTIKIAVGKSEKSNELILKEVTWEQIVKKYTTHTVAAKKGGEYVVGGFFSEPIRDEKYMIGRSLLVVDIDNYQGSIDELAFDLSLLPYKFVAYSSFRHTSEAPRARVIAPLSRVVTPNEYRALAYQACKDMPIPFEAIDTCSWVPNQAMFAPQHAEGADYWVETHGGDMFEVPDVIEGVKKDTVDATDDLMAMVIVQPLEMSDEEVDLHLSAYPSEGKDYDAWIKVGMALYHQYSGAQEGFSRWMVWSESSSKHDPKQMKVKWKSFGGSNNPVTMASVISLVNQAGGITSTASIFEELLSEASEVKDLKSYEAIKTKIKAMSESLLPPIHRAMVINAVYDGFGIELGVRKTDIKKDLQPKKRQLKDISTVDISESSNTHVPNWLKPWIYVQKQCLFYNTDLNYGIRREAFNATYDRERECVDAEQPAHVFALVTVGIETVVDEMFFPLAEGGSVFVHEGMKMINSFKKYGIAPCEELDEEGLAAVEVFKKHIAFTIELEEEQLLFLNWMAYIYQNIGKRVGWAMLLQGAQGTGKSYFGNVLELLLGSNVRSLDTTAISGRFTGWAHGALVNVVEEIRISGTSKHEILDKLKPIITNSVIQIEQKGRDHRTVPNFTSYLLLTNHKDAVPLSDGDRRYCVIFSRVQSEKQLYDELGGAEKAKEYFDGLFDSLRAKPAAIARFLLDWNIPSNFNVNGRAPETSARGEMKALSVSPEKDAIFDLIDTNQCEVINGEILDLTWLYSVSELSGIEIPSSRAVTAILSEMGYSPIEGRRVKLRNRKNHYVWAKKSETSPQNFLTHVKNKIRDFHEKREEFPF